MAKPLPSPEQQALIDADIAKKNAEIARIATLIPTLDLEIADKTSIDDAFKAQFNWYNDSVIGQYNDEREILNGVVPTDPLTNLDVENVVFDPSNARLFPDPGDVDVKRISQFDGTPTTVNATHEEAQIALQAATETQLTSGFGGSSPGGTLTGTLTTTAITPASTSVVFDDTGNADIAFAIGNRFVLDDAGTTVAIEVTSFSEGASDIWTVNFDFIVSGSVGIGSEIDITFAGFTDGERDIKTSIDYQDIMDGLVTALEADINGRISFLDDQKVPKALNEDPDGDFSNTDVDTSKTFLTSYLVSTDISDVGLATLSTERGVRGGEVTARVAAINAAFTGQTEDFYEQRYVRANDRAQIRRGTLTEINRLELSKSSFNQLSTDRTQAVAALESI